MKDLAENIRRIAKQPKLKGALGSQQPREPIPGKVTPYATGAFSTASNGGSSSNGEVATDTNPNDSDSQDDTDTFNPNDPATWNQGGGSGSTETSDQTGYQDFESVVNGDAGPQTPPDNTTDSTSDTGYTGGSVNGFTGITDCSTGQCINLHLTGEFPPPDGWDDADSPGLDPTWEQGFYWTVAGTADDDGDYPSIAIAIEVIRAYADEKIAELDIIDPPNHSPHYYTDDGDDYSTPWGLTIRQVSGSGEGVVSATKHDCLTETGTTRCPAIGPTATQWPQDGCYDLALIDGLFQTSQFDSEAPANAGGSVVSVCYGAGKTGNVYVTANGGVMIAETSGGVPTGTVTVYGSDGTFQAAGDSTPQFMDQYLPK